MRVSWTVSPPPSGLASPVSTTSGSGPLRSTSVWAGRLTGPPASFTEDAVPGALTESSRSPFWAWIARKTPARPPGGSAEPSGAPSTNTLSRVMPFMRGADPARGRVEL